MKSFKIIKTTTKVIIGFCAVLVITAALVPNAFLSADEVDIQPSDITTIGALLDRGLEFLEFFIGGMAFIGFIIAGIQFGTAGGNPDKIQRAKKSMIYCAVGIALAAVSYGLTIATFGIINNAPGR